MLIECPLCKIGFSPSYSACPSCGAYKVRLEDRMEYLAREAQVALEDGATPDSVEATLVEQGLSALDARELVYAKAKKVRRAARYYGVLRLVCGFGLLLLGILLLCFGFFVVFSRHILVLGLIASGAAITLLVLGGYNVLSGRD